MSQIPLVLQRRFPRTSQLSGILAAILFQSIGCLAEQGVHTSPGPDFEAWWLGKMHAEIRWGAPRICHLGGELPAFEVTPATTGVQLVRVSLPFPEGSLPADIPLRIHGDAASVIPDVRTLTRHPGLPKFVRRAILSFPFEFKDTKAVHFRVEALHPWEHEGRMLGRLAEKEGVISLTLGDRVISVTETRVAVTKSGRLLWFAELIAPPRLSRRKPSLLEVENGSIFAWLRIHVPDFRWPRVIEIRADCLGTVAVQVHLQRVFEKDGYAPDLGWRIQYRQVADPVAAERGSSVNGTVSRISFENGEPFSMPFGGGTLAVPEAPLLRKGSVEVDSGPTGVRVTYYRSRSEARVPHQPMAWRRAGFVVAGPNQAIWTSLYEPPHQTRIEPRFYDSLYQSGEPLKADRFRELEELLVYHREAIVGSAQQGDDFGNVTAYGEGGPVPVFGMNRLNHCPPIFEEFYRSGDARLRNVALDWCGNFHDLSIWWGKADDYGGTRYNNATAAGLTEHSTDTRFMWRTNSASHFCTKGMDSFFYAYEETGDTRMLIALEAQMDYVRKHLHAVMPPGEPRNIGVVSDLLRLYRFTGIDDYETEALRLFRELRGCLTPDHLFTQSSAPIEANPPFIDDDAVGYKHPFAKPYIIGYALCGLPKLILLRPEEDRLVDSVRAISHFLADSQDPVGGWRYPHPRSTGCILSQAMEHAHQICNAARVLETRGESIAPLLDAIERVLQARVLVWKKTGKVISSLGGWEIASGRIKKATEIYSLYPKPRDRDCARDYTEGNIGLGGPPPEGLVYLSEVLRFYLDHRPIERLLHPGPELAAVLNRVDESRNPEASGSIPSNNTRFSRFAVKENLPVFREERLNEMTFPGAFDPDCPRGFEEWRRKAREWLLSGYQARTPEAPFACVLVAAEDRGNYEARKLVLNISAWERIPAYLLVPQGAGPFPAVIALHDHGAHFSIGKEKVVRPFQESSERIEDASKWVSESYGGCYIGDELAKRGYVVFAMDALYWGDRGRSEDLSHETSPSPIGERDEGRGQKTAYENQQALASNMLQLGMSWAGVIAHEDLRSAEFVAGLPEVNPDRIGAVGLSMGANRTWHLAAGTDRIKVAAAICWLATTHGLMVPENNQTIGQSAFSMIHPGGPAWMDYPHVASIACPKPMLFFNGEQDRLFPVDSVQSAYETMRAVWTSQRAGNSLVTKIWPVGHVFNREMQDEAFKFLDRHLRGD